MIPQLTKILSSGFTSKQVIDFLLRKYPQYADKIKSTLAAGFTVEQVLKFLGGGRKGVSQTEPTTTEHEQTTAQDKSRRAQVNQAALTTGMLAATPLLRPLATSALERALPSSLQGLAENILPQQPTNISPSTTPLIPQQPPNVPQATAPVSPNIPQIPQTPQPETISINPVEILSKHGIKEKVDSILKARNTPEAVSAFYQKFSPEVKKLIEKETGIPFEKVIEQYTQANQSTNKLPESTEPVETPKIEKSSVVATPHGIGEVKSIKEKNALVEVDGKTHKVPVEELEQSPVPEKDLADLYEDLLRGIEEETGEDVSRMVQWAGYNPETNTLQFLPHTGKLYKYANISPEDAALLRDILSVRKTSGANFIGAWKAGSKSPIGAALSKLIRRLQQERGGKGQEYEETHEPIYSAYEPAIEAKKRKKKKQ